MAEDKPPFSIELPHYIRLLLSWAWLLVLATLLAGVAAYGISALTTPVYQASTLILINEAQSTEVIDYTSVLASERLARTYAELMTTRPILEGVIERAGLTMDASDLRSTIRVTPLRDTQLIRIFVENTNPDLAAKIANGVAAEFIEQHLADRASRSAITKQDLRDQRSQLDKQIEAVSSEIREASGDQTELDRLGLTLAQYRQTYASVLQSYEQVSLAEALDFTTVSQKEPAVPPDFPIRPRTVANTILAAIAGLLLSSGTIIVYESMDETLHDPEAMERRLGLPVLGIIARQEKERSNTADGLCFPAAEAFRALQASLRITGDGRPLRRLLVTSPTPSDGRSTVAANLSIALAGSGLSVVLVDADLRRPCVHQRFALHNQKGLSSWFVEFPNAEGQQTILEQDLQSTGTPGLRVLTAGQPPSNPAGLINPQNIERIIEQVDQLADIQVIDCPPVLMAADAVILASLVDGVLLVIKPSETNLAACRQAVDQLRRAGADLLGIVLNEVSAKRLRNYYLYPPPD